jgi:phosphoadenosine phosphosulfate reductase
MTEGSFPPPHPPVAHPPPADELERLADALEAEGPQAVLAWALARYHPRIALAMSFQAEDCALLDMAVALCPDVRAFYLDTGLLFPETYALIPRLEARYGVRIARYAGVSLEEQEAAHGPRLWERDPDRCCYLRKVAPLRAALAGLDAWITGIRREQTPARGRARVVEWDARFGLVKVNPLAAWDRRTLWAYILRRRVPYNELHDRGYPSIGCAPCTRPVQPGEDPRSGRWPGRAKTECGLHGE